MQYDIRIQPCESRALAVVRRRANLSELSKVVPEACGTVWNVIKSQSIPGAGRNVALYLDEELNLEVGVEMDGAFDRAGEVYRSAIPGGIVATAVHLGPYDRLHEAHTAIRRWCMDRGYSRAGPNWEIYGHWDNDWNSNPAKIRTDVSYLLGPEAAPAG